MKIRAVFFDMGGTIATHTYDRRIELPPERVWREFVFKDCAFRPGQLSAVAEQLAYTVDTCYYQRSMRPEIPGVLQILQGMGLNLGIISNIQSQGQVPGDLSRYGIRQFFDPIVLSCEFGRRKPDAVLDTMGELPDLLDSYLPSGRAITAEIPRSQ